VALLGFSISEIRWLPVTFQLAESVSIHRLGSEDGRSKSAELLVGQCDSFMYGDRMY